MRLPKEEFVRLAKQAVDSLPERFLECMENVSIDVQPEPSAEVLEKAGVEDRRDLLGWYDGVPLTEKSVDALYDLPEVILIYQRNLERICESRAEVVEEIRLTVLHEIAHHFGLEDDEMPY